MKKCFASILAMIVLFSLVGFGSKDNAKIIGDTTIQIGEIIYYNTKEAIPVEPDKSAIVDIHSPAGDTMHDKISAYAIINPGDVDEMVVGCIDGEWYKFLPKGQ